MTPSLTRRRVLLAEDNRDISSSMSALLELEGFDVKTVHDGRDAVDAARVHSPEIILLDIGLAGLDGYYVAERLRNEVALTDTLIVAISGYDAEMFPARARRARFDHHLVKPIDMDVLLTLLSTTNQPELSRSV